MVDTVQQTRQLYLRQTCATALSNGTTVLTLETPELFTEARRNSNGDGPNLHLSPIAVQENIEGLSQDFRANSTTWGNRQNREALVVTVHPQRAPFNEREKIEYVHPTRG